MAKLTAILEPVGAHQLYAVETTHEYAECFGQCRTSNCILMTDLCAVSVRYRCHHTECGRSIRCHTALRTLRSFRTSKGMALPQLSFRIARARSMRRAPCCGRFTVLIIGELTDTLRVSLSAHITGGISGRGEDTSNFPPSALSTAVRAFPDSSTLSRCQVRDRSHWLRNNCDVAAILFEQTSLARTVAYSFLDAVKVSSRHVLKVPLSERKLRSDLSMRTWAT